MTKIKAVIFDCFGVLYTGSLAELANNCPDDESVKELYDLSRAADHGFVSRDDFVSKLMELTSLGEREVVELMNKAQVRSRGVFKYAEDLKQRGYKIAVLSNIGRDTIRQLFDEADYEMFTAIVASGDIGITKPHATAYERTLAKLRVQPEEAIMIDDAYANVMGAMDTGMHGVVFISLTDMKRRVEHLLEED